ncbi:MAG: hypothetical protein K0B11_20420 [Mariniphaga sp.]|nr:hypothetical protein [Mariniphaga sp.]
MHLFRPESPPAGRQGQIKMTQNKLPFQGARYQHHTYTRGAATGLN